MLLNLLCLFFPLISAMQPNGNGVKYKIFKQDANDRAEIDFTKPVRLSFSNISWNTETDLSNEGKLIIYDRKTGKIIISNLKESEANSNLFRLDFKNEQMGIFAAEFYSLPKELSQESTDKIKSYINNGILKRKPFIMRKSKSGQQEVDLFSSKADMDIALEVFKKQYNLIDLSDAELSQLVLSNSTMVESKVIYSSAILNASMQTEKNIIAENKKNLESQEALLQIEKLAKQKKIIEQEKFNAAEQASRKIKADSLAKKALNSYTSGEYDDAQLLFEQSFNLNPLNEKYYYFYGISLYRNENYNKSIAVLTNAIAPEGKESEKLFYLAMNYFSLKDYANASVFFGKTITASKNNKSLDISSHFYQGICELETAKYKESIDSFQYVLDNSEDEEMDKKAEDYIEYVVRKQELERRFSKKLFVNALIGTMYDNNMLFATDSARDQGTAADIEGYRLLTQAQTRYRPFYDEKNEFSGTVGLTNLYSVNNKFSRTTNVIAVDPTILSFGLPWTHKTKIENIPYSFDLAPGFETTYLDPDSGGFRSILDSYMVSFNNSLLNSEKWITNVNLQLRYDNSNLSITNEADNQDSFKISLGVSASYLLSEESQQYIIPEISYISNNSDGSNYNYTRADIGISYAREIFWHMLWNSKLSYYAANYKSDRNDNNYTFQSSLSKLLGAQWNLTLFANYTLNNSNTNQYNRFTMMSAISYSY